MYILNIYFQLVHYIKNLKSSQFEVISYQRPPGFCFTSWIWQHVKNTFCNLVLPITQGEDHYGQLFSSTQNFFQTFTTSFFCPRYPKVLIVVSERNLGVLQEKYNFDRGNPRQNVKTKVKKSKKLTLVWFKAMLFILGNKIIFWNRYFLNDVSTNYHSNNLKLSSELPYNKWVAFKVASCYWVRG